MQAKRAKRERTYAQKTARGERPFEYSAEYKEWRRNPRDDNAAFAHSRKFAPKRVYTPHS